MKKILLELQKNKAMRINLFDCAKDNNQEYFRSLKEGVFVEMAYEGAELVKWNENYRVLDHKNEKVVFYLEWKTTTFFGKKAAYQIIIWSDPFTTQVRGFAQKNFYELLFKENELIFSAISQTSKDQRLFNIIVGSALEKDLFVYSVDMKKNPIELIRLKNETELKEKTEQANQKNLVLISIEAMTDKIFTQLDQSPLEMILKDFF